MKNQSNTNPLAAFGFISGLIFVLIGGCGVHNHRGRAVSIVPKNIISEPLPVIERIKVVHDTIPKKISNAEMQAYLEPFYKANYDKLFAPDLKKLGNVILSQQQSIDKLTDVIKEVRARAIKRADIDRKKFDELQTDYVKIQRAQVLKNAVQISQLNSITSWLLALGVLMILGIVALFIIAWIFYRKLKYLYKLYQSIAHV